MHSSGVKEAIVHSDGSAVTVFVGEVNTTVALGITGVEVDGKAVGVLQACIMTIIEVRHRYSCLLLIRNSPNNYPYFQTLCYVNILLLFGF